MVAFADLVTTLTGLAETLVIIGYGDGSVRDVSHIELHELTDDGVGFPTRSGTTHTHTREVPVLVTAYGTAAVTALSKLPTQLWGDTLVMHTAVAAGLTIRGVSPISNQTAIQTTSYEPRASLTVTIGYVHTQTGVAGPTEATSVEVEVQGEEDVIVVTP